MTLAVVLALASAASWGSSDFMAGVAGRRSTTLSVVLGTHLTGLLVVTALVSVQPVGAAGSDLLWGAAAGLSGAFGAALLYRGLAIGTMGVVAPLTAAGAASVPVAFGLLTGEDVSRTVVTGLVLALVAIVLLSSTGGSALPSMSATGFRRLRKVAVHRALQPGVAEALLSGLGFAGFFICMGKASSHAGLWPLFTARLASVALLAAVATAKGGCTLPATGARLSVVLAGVLDIAAATLYLVATRHGALSVVAVLASLYPAATVSLARVVEGERYHRLQLSGMVAACGGVALIMLH